jgi:hypothetical protein
MPLPILIGFHDGVQVLKAPDQNQRVSYFAQNRSLGGWGGGVHYLYPPLSLTP